MGLSNQFTKMARKTEGSNPGGGLVVEKLFLGRNVFPRVVGQEASFHEGKKASRDPRLNSFRKKALSLPTSLTKLFRSSSRSKT